MTAQKQGTKQVDNVLTLGIDSSTTNCGVAYFINGKLNKTENYAFTGKYSLDKLNDISTTFHKVFKDNAPTFILLEEPINVRSRRAAMALNQVAGAICAVAFLQSVDVFYMHNLTIKKALGLKSKHKSEVTKLMKETFPEILAHATEHECDAVAVVEAYKKLYIESLDFVDTVKPII